MHVLLSCSGRALCNLASESCNKRTRARHCYMTMRKIWWYQTLLGSTLATNKTLFFFLSFLQIIIYNDANNDVTNEYSDPALLLIPFHPSVSPEPSVWTRTAVDASQSRRCQCENAGFPVIALPVRSCTVLHRCQSQRARRVPVNHYRICNSVWVRHTYHLQISMCFGFRTRKEENGQRWQVH